MFTPAMAGLDNKKNYFNNRRAAITIAVVLLLAILLAIAIGLYFENKVEKLKHNPAAQTVGVNKQILKKNCIAGK